MRVRALSAVAAVVLAAAGLSGCRTNVGVAATVDGQRITESDINQFITVNAKPVVEQNSSGGSVTISPRPFVLETLIDVQLLAKLLAATPGGAPSESTIATATAKGLNGSTLTKVAEGAGLHGYTAAFDQQWVRSRVLGTILNNEAQQGLDVRAIVAKVPFPVSVNPRYGTWDKANLHLASDGNAGLPTFIQLQPTSTTAPSAGASGTSAAP
ncbi:MAG: hypothetical protein QOH52_235 [Pseudonocardiales bacterium]|nr:hypothetical protein [Pseudonocardiales bacterium]